MAGIGEKIESGKKPQKLEAGFKADVSVTRQQAEAAKRLSQKQDFKNEVKKSSFFADLAKKYKVLGQVATLAAAFVAFEKPAFGDEIKPTGNIVNVDKNTMVAKAETHELSREAQIAQKRINFFLDKLSPVEYKGDNLDVQKYVREYNATIEIGNELAKKYPEVLAKGDFYKLKEDGSLDVAPDSTQAPEYNQGIIANSLRTVVKDIKGAAKDVSEGFVTAESTMELAGIEKEHDTLKGALQAAETTSKYGDKDIASARQ